MGTDDLQALFDHANALHAQQRLAEALASHERLLALQPNLAEVWNNRGNVLRELGRAEDALDSFDRALGLAPQHALALTNRGAALLALQRPDEALASCDASLRHAPGLAQAHCNRAEALAQLGRPDEALASYAQALALLPGHVQALVNSGNLLLGGGRLAEALACYAGALQVDPDHPFLFGHWLHTKMKACDWAGLDAAFARLAQGIAQGRPVSRPFPVLATPLGADLQRQCAAIYVRDVFARTPLTIAAPPSRADGRLHIGYFSAGLGDHALSHLAAGLFEHHDRTRFEVTAFSFGPATPGAMRTRLQAAFDRFIDVRDLADDAVAALARRLGIHIAIDLDGYTHGSRPGILALRAAPLQLSAIGYPGTMSAPWIDYLLADATLVPLADSAHYAEKLVLLPDSYQVNDSRRAIAAGTPSRSALGLPDAGFVFCCFNQAFKITPDVFELWMRLLHRVDASVLWLLPGTAQAALSLRAEAGARGVDPERLVFAPRVAMPTHLARQRRADLFLDTFHCGAHTTASDALWAGLPVLTRIGQSFASRVGASLLNAIGLPELVTRSSAEYEALALRLATQPEALSALARRLSANRLTHPLFDSQRYTHHLEAAYATMWQRHQAGLAPDHSTVPP